MMNVLIIKIKGVVVKKINISLIVFGLFIVPVSLQGMQQISSIVYHEDRDVVNKLLLLIYDHLERAIYSCALNHRLHLDDVYTATDRLFQLCASGMELCIHDQVINNIVQLINIRLTKNPTLISFLTNINASVEPWQRLSENEFAMILKNSALLVSIDELFSFSHILHVIGVSDAVLNIEFLQRLLKKVELDVSKTPLELWEKRDFLRRLYVLREYQATTIVEKIKYTKQSACIQKNIDTIFAALKITDQYADALKKIESLSCYSQKKLYELFEDAFCGESSGLSLAAYARYIEKCVQQNEKIFGRHHRFLGKLDRINRFS